MTYAWIAETASSRINKAIATGSSNGSPNHEIIPNKRLINRCPAIMLAVSRIDRVIGRIIILINSIRTINIANHRGPPLVQRCAKYLIRENDQSYVQMDTRVIVETENVTAICAVMVKEKATSPMILYIKTVVKIIRKNTKLMGLSLLGRRVNSFDACKRISFFMNDSLVVSIRMVITSGMYSIIQLDLAE